MLYLVDKPHADVAFRTARDDPDARIVFIQDGVLVDPVTDVPALDVPMFAVERDVEVRGVDLPDSVERVSYDTLMSFVLEDQVRTFI